MKMQELLDSPDKWVQNAPARDKDGESVPSLSYNAVKWCLLGAIIKCYPLEYREIVNRIRDVIEEPTSIYNDSHSYEEVMDLVRRLDI